MKVIGIQINSTEAVLVVLEEVDGTNTQTDESIKFHIEDIYDCVQVRQFRNQINMAFETIKPDRVGIYKRNAFVKGKMAPSPASFKLEGIIQLYEKIITEFVAPQTLKAFFRKNECPIHPMHKYQQDAFDVAFYLLNNK